MTTYPRVRQAISARRVAAVAQLRMRRVVRTRILLVALVLALLPWAIVEDNTLLARLSALATFTIAGITALAAGAVADDVDDGEFAIVATHGATPLEVLGGQAAATLVLTALLVALQLPIALRGIPVPRLLPLVLCIAWLAALLAGWLAVMLLLATFLEGKANALAMIGVIGLPFVLGAGLLDRLPHFAAVAVRNALALLPQVDHATAMFRAVLSRSPAPPMTPFVLIASPLVYFALASVRLARIQPAGRLTQ